MAKGASVFAMALVPLHRPGLSPYVRLAALVGRPVPALRRSTNRSTMRTALERTTMALTISSSGAVDRAVEILTIPAHELVD